LMKQVRDVLLIPELPIPGNKKTSLFLFNFDFAL